MESVLIKQCCLCDEYILKILNCYYIKTDEINLTDDLLD